MGLRGQDPSGLKEAEGLDRPAYTQLPGWWVSPDDNHPDWPALRIYAVHTKPRQEKALAARLDSAGVSCYLPLSRRLKSWQHRRRVVHEPLFAGYLFANCTVDQTYEIHSSGRAVQVIASPDPRTTASELAQIDLAVQSGAALDPYPFLTKGRRVFVARGPLRGVEGEVDERSCPLRMVLKISTLGRAVALEIDSAALEPLE